MTTFSILFEIIGASILVVYILIKTHPFIMVFQVYCLEFYIMLSLSSFYSFLFLVSIFLPLFPFLFHLQNYWFVHLFVSFPFNQVCQGIIYYRCFQLSGFGFPLALLLFYFLLLLLFAFYLVSLTLLLLISFTSFSLVYF